MVAYLAVLELVREFAAVSGRPVPYRIVERRPGDVPKQMHSLGYEGLIATTGGSR